MPDGSLGVCAMMRMAAGGWSAGEFVQPAAFTAAIPAPAIAATLALPADAWQRRMPAGEGGFRSGECESEVPRAACLLGVHLDARRLLVTDSAGGVVATLELREEKRSGNPLFWPLVPLGYVGDVALALVAIPATIVVVAIVAPFALIAAPFMDDPPLRPDPPLPAPCPVS
jgi:hypothetical protein